MSSLVWDRASSTRSSPVPVAVAVAGSGRQIGEELVQTGVGLGHSALHAVGKVHVTVLQRVVRHGGVQHGAALDRLQFEGFRRTGFRRTLPDPGTDATSWRVE